MKGGVFSFNFFNTEKSPLRFLFWLKRGNKGEKSKKCFLFKIYVKLTSVNKTFETNKQTKKANFNTKTSPPVSLCYSGPTRPPHVVVSISDLFHELLSQNSGPLQTLGFSLWTAPVYTDQINWTHIHTRKYTKHQQHEA